MSDTFTTLDGITVDDIPVKFHSEDILIDSFEVDPTLTVSGAAADAKVTGDEIAALKEDLTEITDVSAVEYIIGEYVETTNPIHMENGVPVTTGSSSSWKSAIIPCTEGDVFTIRGTSNNANLRAWRFSRADGYYISESTSPFNTTDDLILTAPANSAWLILNSNDLNCKSYVGEFITKRFDDTITYVDNTVKEATGSLKINYTIGKYVQTTNPLTMVDGVPVTTGESPSWKSAIIQCSEGDTFTINGASNNANLRAWFFATSAGAYISESVNGFDVDNNLILTAPANSAWLILNSNSPTRDSYIGTSIDARFGAIADTVAENAETSDYNDAMVINSYASTIKHIEITDVDFVNLQIDNGGVVNNSTVRKCAVCKIVPNTYINITKIQTRFAWIGFSTNYPAAGTTLNRHTNKNGMVNTEIGLQSESNDHYMIFMYYDINSDSSATDIEESMCVYYDSAEYSQFDMISHADSHLINLLKYRPVGRVQKSYIAISCDDGNAVLATYTIPRIKQWKQTYGKNIPVTFALFNTSDVMANDTYKALTIDACENDGCAIAIHGVHSFFNYPTRKQLMDYVQKQDDYLYAETGVKPNAVIYPEHDYNDFIQTYCGSFYNACGCGGNTHNLAYEDASGRPFYIGEKSNCYEIYRLAIHDTRITSLEDVEAIVDYAYDNNLIICPYFHDVDLGDSAPNKTFLRSVLDKFVSYGVSKGIDFIKLGDIPYVL